MANKKPDKDESNATDESGEVKDVEPEFITVRSARSDNRTAFFEQHKRHPGGEAFVAGSEPVKVAKTPEVLRALNDRRIVEVK
jgi:hypothetical protein